MEKSGLREQFNHVEIGDTPDPVTGLDTKPTLRDALFLSLKNQKNAYLIEADFLNLGNLNASMGREFSNDFMRMTASLVVEEISKAQPGTLYGYRKNGSDEATFMVGGLDETRLRAALENAQQRLTDYVGKTDLAKLVHHKEGRPAGIGLSTVYKRLEPSHHFESLRNALQLEIGAEKEREESVPTGDTLTPEQFLGHASKDFSSPLTLVKDEPALRIDNVTARGLEKFIGGTGGERDLMLHHLMQAKDGGTLLRIDLKNFKTLNADLGNEEADEIIRSFKLQLKGLLKKQGLETARIYQTGGDTLDIICTDCAAHSLEVVKSKVGFVLENVFDTAGVDMAGKVKPFVVDAPIIPGSPYATLDQADLIKMAYDAYGISHISHYEGYDQLHFFDAEKQPLKVDRARISGQGLAKLSSASHALDKTSFETIFKNPVGQISAYMFGANLSPVLTAQAQMKLMLAENVPAEEIEKHMDTPEQFAAFFKSRLPEAKVHDFNMLRIPENHDVWLKGRMRTMELAQGWGYVDGKIGDMILEGQAAQRTLNVLQNNGALNAEAAKVSLEKDILMFVTKVPDADTRRIQTAWQIAEFIKKTDDYKSTQLFDDGVKNALRIVAHCAFYKLGEDVASMNRPHLQAVLQGLMDSSYDYDLPQAGQIILDTLGKTRRALKDEPDIQAKLDALRESFETALPDLSMAPATGPVFLP